MTTQQAMAIQLSRKETRKRYKSEDIKTIKGKNRKGKLSQDYCIRFLQFFGWNIAQDIVWTPKYTFCSCQFPLMVQNRNSDIDPLCVRCTNPVHPEDVAAMAAYYRDNPTRKWERVK